MNKNVFIACFCVFISTVVSAQVTTSLEIRGRDALLVIYDKDTVELRMFFRYPHYVLTSLIISEPEGVTDVILTYHFNIARSWEYCSINDRWDLPRLRRDFPEIDIFNTPSISFPFHLGWGSRDEELDFIPIEPFPKPPQQRNCKCFKAARQRTAEKRTKATFEYPLT